MNLTSFLFLSILFLLAVTPVFYCYHSPRQYQQGPFGLSTKPNPGYKNWPKAFLYGALIPLLQLLKSLLFSLLFISLLFGLLLALTFMMDL